MKKIVYLPLDERPCNLRFPPLLFHGVPLRITAPPVLGEKKKPASWEEIERFLTRECRDADGLVLSMDMLLYGGLVPSRLHHLRREAVENRLSLLKQLKAARPDLIIYAAQCIMRCPQYSSDEEEPDYYAQCGREIYLLGDALHRSDLGLCDKAEIEKYAGSIPTDQLKDYTDRRAFNLYFNLRTLEFLAEGILDFLIFPQDDAAPYGFTAMDQAQVRKRIADLRVESKVLMYPGADETGLTLISRMALLFAKRRPKIYIKYASVRAPFVIPCYEDRPVGETIKYQIIASGCRVASSAAEAEIVLGVSLPGCAMGDMLLGAGASNAGYRTERNLEEWALFLQDCLVDGKIVTVADNAYANGGDPELIALLDQMDLLGRIDGYAGWNTSSNTLGTAIASGVRALLYGVNKDFLALRYLEDAGYCSEVRKRLMNDELKKRGFNDFRVGEQRGEVSRLAAMMLRDYAPKYLISISDHIVIHDVWMPWKRVFEIGLDVEWIHDSSQERSKKIHQ